MDKTEIKELIRKIFDTTPHPNIKDDFDFIWEMQETFNRFSDFFFKAVNFEEEIGRFDIPQSVTKGELLKYISDYDDDVRLSIYQDECSDICISAYKSRKETDEEIAKRMYSVLIQWAHSSDYALYKKIHLLEQENAELKEKASV